MTETPTPDEIARWAHEHRQRDDGDECYGCWCDAVVETWPCPIARLLALVAAQAEQNAGQSNHWRDHWRAQFRGERDAAVQRAERAEAELSALRATDEYQRWARAVTERDAARERIMKALQFVNHELADAVLTEFDHGAHSALAEIRAALDQPTPREETTG